MLKFCRMCLREIRDNDFISSKEDKFAEIKLHLAYCVPDLVINRVKDSVICCLCVTLLKSYYFLKEQCRKTEIRVKKYLEKMNLTECNIADICCYNSEKNSVQKQTEDSSLLTLMLDKDGSNMGVPAAKVKKKPRRNTSITETASVLPDTPVEPTVTIDGSDLVTVIDSEDETRANEGVKDYVCSQCGYTASFEYVLILHNKVFHNEVSLQSSDCNNETYPGDNLVKNVGSLHNNAIKDKVTRTKKYFECNVCPFRTTHKGSFTIHSKSHGTKQYSCQMCDYTTNSIKFLIRHGRLHQVREPNTSLLKTYLLPGSISSGASDIALNKLLRDKPYSCTKCSFKTATYRGLKLHTRRHNTSLLKPYHCHLCDFRSKYRANVKAHMLEVHKKILIQETEDDQAEQLLTAKAEISMETLLQ